MKKKTFMGIIALILAAALTIAAGIGSAVDGKWFKNPHFETWFNSWGKDKPADDNVDPTSGAGGALISDNASNSIQLRSARIAPEDYAAYGISAQSDSAFSVSVEVLPADTTDKGVTCAASFVNASSTWARGKNVSDYVTVTGTNPFIVTCKQAFGEQIRLTYTATSNSNCTATSDLDYIKTVSSVNISIGSDKIAFKSSGSNTYTVSSTPVYGVGTVEPVFTFKYCALNCYGNRFDYTASWQSWNDETQEYEDREETYFPEATHSVSGNQITVSTPQKTFFKVHSSNASEINNIFIKNSNGVNDVSVNVHYEVTLTAASYSKNGDYSKSFGFDVSAMKVTATALTPSNAHMYFGG